MSEAPTNVEAVPSEKEGQRKLSKNMVTSITLLCFFGGLSIIALMFGDFEGRISRVVSTLILFAAFTIFSALEEKRTRSPLETGVFQIGSIYMLIITLFHIWSDWGSSRTSLPNEGAYRDSYYYFDPVAVFMGTIFLILITRVGVYLIQKAVQYIYAPQSQLSLTAKLAAVALTVTLVLFTLPIALDPQVRFGELYWRFAVAILVFACLAISIGLWMAHSFKQPLPWSSTNSNKTSQKLGNGTPGNTPAVASARPTGSAFISAPVPFEAPRAQAPVAPAPSQNNGGSILPQFTPPAQNVMAWPMMPFGGQPVPKNQHDRPDWDALITVVKTYAEAEKHFGPRP
jgi:hypothetical protein